MERYAIINASTNDVLSFQESLVDVLQTTKELEKTDKSYGADIPYDYIEILSSTQHSCMLKKYLSILFKNYETTTLGYDLYEVRINDIYNEVLKKEAFFAAEYYPAKGVKKGDRITDETFTFLLSDEDFDHLQELVTKRLQEEGMCNEQGCDIVPWVTLRNDARNALLDFIIAHIVPANTREVFAKNRSNYTVMEKLISLSKKLITVNS